MSKSQHGYDDATMTQNQNNQMSDDPGDGSRNAFTAKQGANQGKSPEEEAQEDPSTLEAFGEAGAGIAPKE